MVVRDKKYDREEERSSSSTKGYSIEKYKGKTQVKGD